ncbi:hypothetical protein GTW58_10680 [Kocuria subflava]|uniref:Cation-transporting P-type ATPase N-terminal domain-containing protein n=1 Tax=Kocuria subflava TaxID=1736139 RepID=A0A846TXM1_9MICC|nr:hypothetical protein [Kocuria subflava]
MSTSPTAPHRSQEAFHGVTDPHALSAQEVMDHLDVDPHTGLQCAQADARREHVGPNKLPDPARATWWCASSSTSTMS